MLSGMADEKASTTQAQGALDATAQNARAAQERLDGLLNVARLAREAQARRGRTFEPLRPARS